MSKSELESTFAGTWALLARSLGLPLPEPQVMLNAPVSKHVWDFVWAASKVAVEIQGGTWLPGHTAHAGGSGASRDAKKNNLAVLNGYVVLYATSDMLNQTHIMDFLQTVATVLQQRGEPHA
jgi:very-short-patch-repair endonuclease